MGAFNTSGIEKSITVSFDEHPLRRQEDSRSEGPRPQQNRSHLPLILFDIVPKNIL